ncbi:NADH-dependent [FeFe] hydrogenase, group A6 [Acetohalobium arabaticum]|uniref:NAD(P)-dependent iron-only hydrogenase catalytic subunit n=1 Tax=Acetohalobium arabaticum (strain ATCC 49924 / DSM 5501 / Z-7288) TaxID=574087 RepID=D9QTQ6_ACEAZ|nr:NADH-dependent [FeFe] hydrogenase, group A6 [Acetohalobium arabaticum]ADL11820.1 NAD(P)-dependent iron-only hydrogenase catalytic subunit [Acetohalobium arabaticum DSM 5501]
MDTVILTHKDTVRLTIDGQEVEVEKGSTVLEAARELGIELPTLCYHEELTLFGSCRVCEVEDEETGNLMASCVTPVTEGMKIRTNSSKARRARRMNVELLLANHPNECLTCDRNGTCELQQIAYDLGVHDIRFEGDTRDHPIDNDGPCLERDPNKCILCGRCVRVCNEIQEVAALDFTERGFNSTVTTAFDLPQSEINCTNCGQCAVVCPVGAITEVSEISDVWDALEDEDQHVVVQVAPAIQASIGEEFGMEPGTIVTGKLVTALQELGFDKIFSTEFTADLTIMEEGNELLKRIKGQKKLPQFTSCCPGWVKFCEHNYPEYLDNLSTAKSPQQMFSTLAKTYYAEQEDIDPEDIFTVSVMPCTAKKFEKNREEMADSGHQDTDAVLTTREAARMIKEMGIQFHKLTDSKYDKMMGAHTGAGTIFGTTGGVMEAALRTAYEVLTDDELPRLDLTEVRGMDGIRDANVQLNGDNVKVAVVHGLKNAADLLDKIEAGEIEYDFVEVMACPGGCIGGGGQPFASTTMDVKAKRAEALYQTDKANTIRKSHENPQIIKLYEDYLGEPLSSDSHHLLHTSYQERSKN